MVMDTYMLFAVNIAVIIGFLFIWSVMVFRKKNFSLFEIGWPLSLVLATAVSFLLYGSASIYRRLLVLTVTIWGLRLAFYLYTHYWGRPEGPRFVKMREKSGSKLTGIKAFFTLFFIPAIVFSLVSLPITIGFLESQTTLAWWQYSGLGLWALGLLLEMGTEYQLKRFKNKPGNEGQLITKGFWRLTRHPHYFGTAVVWWGIYLLTVVNWTNLEAVLISILSPIAMTLFLVYLASQSTVEAEYKEREDLQSYTRKTPQFFPFASKIGAALLAMGRLIGKGTSKIAASGKKKQSDSMENIPNEIDLASPVIVDEPVKETTSETTWFKPEIEAEDLAAHDDTLSDVSEEIHSVSTDSSTEYEPSQEESSIDEMLADNEFSTLEEAKTDDAAAENIDEEVVSTLEPLVSEEITVAENLPEKEDSVQSAHLDYQNEAPTDFPEVPTFEDLPGDVVRGEESISDIAEVKLDTELEGEFKEVTLNEADELNDEDEASAPPIELPKSSNFDDVSKDI